MKNLTQAEWLEAQAKHDMRPWKVRCETDCAVCAEKTRRTRESFRKAIQALEALDAIG